MVDDLLFENTGTPQVIDQIKLQLKKLVPVHNVADFKREDKQVIFKEMALLKVVGKNGKRENALKACKKFNPVILDKTNKSFVIQITALRREIDKMAKNLKKFEDKTIYNVGYIPESLFSEKSPKSVIYIHIDLNSAKPTLATLEFFFPKLIKGGVILFDDYGQEEYIDTKKVIDKFFSNKSGMLLKLPTSQAIYFR